MDANLKLNKAVSIGYTGKKGFTMFYCYCKLWNSATQECWIFGRWYKDAHYNDIPKKLTKKANSIVGEDEPFYYSLSYNCVKVRDDFSPDRKWYNELYKATDKCNNWLCVGLA